MREGISVWWWLVFGFWTARSFRFGVGGFLSFRAGRSYGFGGGGFLGLVGAKFSLLVVAGFRVFVREGISVSW